MKHFFSKTIHIFFAFLLSTGLLMGQDMDERMSMDIELMQKTLSEMLREAGYSISRNVKGDYIKDLGILFTINSKGYSVISTGEAVTIARSSNAPFVIRNGQRNGLSATSPNDQLGIAGTARSNANPVSLENFFTRYASFASQLSDEEAVIVSLNQSPVLTAGFFSETPSEREVLLNKNSKVTLKVLMKDVRAYKKGTLSEEDLKKRIVREEVSLDAVEPYEFKAFGKIIDEKAVAIKADVTRLVVKGKDDYKDDAWKVKNRYSFGDNDNMEHIPGIGYTYTINFVVPEKSSAIYLTYDGRWEEETSERLFIKKAMKDMFSDEKTYEEWHKALITHLVMKLPKHILNYGRVLESLPEDEKLIVAFNLPENKYGLSEKLSFTVGKKTLEKYGQGGQSLEAASKEVYVSY